MKSKTLDRRLAAAEAQQRSALRMFEDAAVSLEVSAAKHSEIAREAAEEQERLRLIVSEAATKENQSLRAAAKVRELIA